MTDRTQSSVQAFVNGELRAVDADTRIADLVEQAWGRSVAVARNRQVVPRADWATTRVQEGDEIEIVRPIQGG